MFEDQSDPSILPRKIDIANFGKCVTTIQLHVVALIFSLYRYYLLY